MEGRYAVTHFSQHLLLAPALGLLQPGCVAWLQAAAGHRTQPGRATPPVRTSHTTPAPLHAGSSDSTVQPKALRRLGSETRYVRRWLQPRLHELYEALYRSALSGDMEATRLLLRMGGLDGKTEAEKKKPTKTGPGFAKKAMEEFRAR